MERKKKGRKGLGLSESAKKQRKKEQDRERQSGNKSVLMSLATHERWVALAERHGLTSRQLAVVLLDAVDDGKLHFDASIYMNKDPTRKRLFESKKAKKEGVHQHTSKELQPSDEQDYQTFTVTEAVPVLEDSWIAEDITHRIPEKKGSPDKPESEIQEAPSIGEEQAYHTDCMQGDDIGDGKETEAQPPADYHVLYIKEEPLDSDDTEDLDTNAYPGILMGQSLKEEAGNSSSESRDGVDYFDAHSTSQAEFLTQSDTYERESSMNDNLPPHVKLLVQGYSGNSGVATKLGACSSSVVPQKSSAPRSKNLWEELRRKAEMSANQQKQFTEEDRIHYNHLSKLRMTEIERERRQRMTKLEHEGKKMQEEMEETKIDHK